MTDWKLIETAPKGGVEFQMWAFMGDWDKNGYWIPCGKFETPRSLVPSAYLYESHKFVKTRKGQVKYWAHAVVGPEGQPQIEFGSTGNTSDMANLWSEK